MSKAIHRALGIARRGDDTGMNIPESGATLKAQQEQLVTNNRAVQMFPKGTRELPLPRGMKRLVTPRGVFHYNPEKISPETIIAASAKGHEHSLPGLGSVPKAHVTQIDETFGAAGTEARAIEGVCRATRVPMVVRTCRLSQCITFRRDQIASS